jgi:3-oxoacyl-[acyl-carrier-protein] synthase II
MASVSLVPLGRDSGVLGDRLQDEIVITGMGCISPVGLSADSTWAAMLEGESGIRTITQFDSEKLPAHIAGEVVGFDAEGIIGLKQARRMARFSQFAIAASEEAVATSGIDLDKEDRDLCGVLIGSGVGGLKVTEDATLLLDKDGHRRISPFVVPMMIGDMASGNVSMRFDLRGPNFGMVSACSSGAHALGEAAAIIRRGDADVMVAGGTESCITPLAVASFCAARALSESTAPPHTVSRPFDLARDGFVMGEGAAVFVLETRAHAERRGAPILAVIAGYAATADAFHMTAPHPEGRGAISSMKRAIERAGLKPEDVDYVNAHGTSTPLNDKAEAAAIHAVFDGKTGTLPVSSTKSMTGHLLGAAGALESVVCVKAITSGMVPPTINLESPDPECDLDHVTGGARRVDVKVALNNSFGFGGHNASLVFTAATA